MTVKQCQDSLAKIDEEITKERKKGANGRDNEKIGRLQAEHFDVTAELVRAQTVAAAPKATKEKPAPEDIGEVTKITAPEIKPKKEKKRSFTKNW
jgi:hypothetical protein